MNTSNAGVQLDDLQRRIDSLKNDSDRDFPAVKADLNILHKACLRVAASWSGSSHGRHSSLYFERFRAPSAQQMFDPEWGLVNGMQLGWSDRSNDEVMAEIERGYGGRSIVEIEDEITQKADVASQLQQELLAELSWLKSNAESAPEITLLDEIEAIHIKVPSSKTIRVLIVAPSMSRDSVAITQGLRAAPHATYQARTLAIMATITNIETFLSKSRRLMRQVEISVVMNHHVDGTAEAIKRVERICKRFHQVTRQLRSRHAGRPTLDINDEYDVQDLLHALLKIDFDDIRAEDWAPSYASGATRMDFVLKIEQVVIEVKKTRDGLSDKEVGEQLIVDIAKYQQSADCRTLICFVYDPEGKIGNPAGLIADLSNLSNDQISVLVFIEPSA